MIIISCINNVAVNVRVREVKVATKRTKVMSIMSVVDLPGVGTFAPGCIVGSRGSRMKVKERL